MVDQHLRVLVKPLVEAVLNSESSQYWNATAICKWFNKRFNAFLRSPGSVAFIRSTADRMGITADDIVVETERGTMVCRDVAIEMLSWANADAAQLIAYRLADVAVRERLGRQGRPRAEEATGRPAEKISPELMPFL